MFGLSLRLSRVGLLAAVLLGHAAEVQAQVPLWRPAPPPEPEAAEPEAAHPPTESKQPDASRPAPERLGTLPAPAWVPSAVAPGAGGGAPPPPAKALRIAQQSRLDTELDDHDDEPAGPQSPSERSWYGWQTLTADGISLAVLLASGLSGGSDRVEGLLGSSALLGYGFAPGVIHFAHRNPGRGLASFGVRLGMPLVGAFVGATLASGCDGFLCEASGAGVGALLGIGGAIAIDAAVFAYEDARPTTSSIPRLRPLFSVTRERAWIGMSGAL